MQQFFQTLESRRFLSGNVASTTGDDLAATVDPIGGHFVVNNVDGELRASPIGATDGVTYAVKFVDAWDSSSASPGTGTSGVVIMNNVDGKVTAQPIDNDGQPIGASVPVVFVLYGSDEDKAFAGSPANGLAAQNGLVSGTDDELADWAVL